MSLHCTSASTSQEMRQGSCSLGAGVAKPAPAAEHFSLDTTPPFATPLSATGLHCDRLWRAVFKPCLLNAHQRIRNISVILS